MTTTPEFLYPHAWTPDHAVVDAVQAGRIRLADLNREDRALVVATLTHRGRSVDQISDRLDCCTRVVKRIRADPLTSTLARLLDAEQRADDAERHGHLDREHHARTTAELEDDRDRYRKQADDLYKAITHRREGNL